MLGFGLGMGSICCWLVAQLPQIILNHQTQSVEALSAFFLASWLLVRNRDAIRQYLFTVSNQISGV